jgi:hypothetical protein
MLTISCTVTEREYVAAMWTHLRPRPSMRVVGLLLACLFLAVTAMVVNDLRAPGTSQRTSWFFLAILAYLLFTFLVWTPLRARRLFRQHKGAGDPFTLTFESGALEFSNARGHAKLPWDHFRKWKESRVLFLLYHTDVMYQIIPKRCFSDDQLGEFRTTLLQHVRRVV